MIPCLHFDSTTKVVGHQAHDECTSASEQKRCTTLQLSGSSFIYRHLNLFYSVLFSQKVARLCNPFKDGNSEGVFVDQMHQSINRPRKESVFEMCTCNLIQSARVMTLPPQVVRVKSSRRTTMVFLQNTHGLK